MNRTTKTLAQATTSPAEQMGLFLSSFSCQHQKILKYAGAKTVTDKEVAIALLAPERSILSAMGKLNRDRILERVGPGKYKVADSDFAQYLETFDAPPISREIAIEQSKKLVYQALLPFWQSLAKDGLIGGDAEGMAIVCGKYAGNVLKKNWRENA